MSDLSASTVLARLHALQSDQELRKYARYFKSGVSEFIGVRMGHVFDLAKEMVLLPPAESRL